MYLSRDNFLWVADGMTNKFLKYDLNGKLLYSWGTFGAFPGGMWGPHQFSRDSQGSVYRGNFWWQGPEISTEEGRRSG
jgi:hypothetical protein